MVESVPQRREKKLNQAKRPVFFSTKVVEIYRQTFRLFAENPTVVLLFFVIALLDSLALTLLFLSHSKPVSIVLAPLIRTFYSERFLHYPMNFVILPKIFQHAHFLILSVAGLLVTGMVIQKIEQYTLGRSIATLDAAGVSIKKYPPLLGAWIVSYGIFMVALRVMRGLLPNLVWIHLSADFVLSLCIQSLFAYLLPSIMLSGRGFLRGLGYGLEFGVRNFFVTCSLILAPILLMSVFAYLRLLTHGFIQINPELTLWVLGTGIIVSMIVDMVITSSTTLLYLEKEATKP
ncbi:MAG: hypothetical protein NC930_03170 [Candidatus Omnitrophica bacterium]|nr:hypothetical protein [Candidatus Omnitrophota bacterium]